ncbi:spore coat protein GerQ [Peribacillus tepidiphilus]|jgi:spore germination protein Q|uniref:spore coat protein GerQ n=1 Tax=Peribacillus tepidiphilus TaxID=2652445 RepID=UPI0035B521A8
MNQNNSNPYVNYGYTAPQAQYYGGAQNPQQEAMYRQMQYYQQQQQQTAQPGMQVPFPVSAPTTAPQIPGMLPLEQSYIENILRLNKGKLATIYATFENNREWNAKIFKGIIEAAGRDHVILSDPQTGTRYLLPMVYVDYITFDEEIEYEYPFNSVQPMATYSPR